MKKTRIMSLLLCMTMLLSILTGCSSVYTETDDRMSYDDAVTETASLLKKVSVKTVNSPTMDIYSDEVSEADALADIDTFPLTVIGTGTVNIEIAGATELTADAPDDWLNVVARDFNKQRYQLDDGRTVSVSVRKITSGEVLTYMTQGDYRPTIYIPSNDAWGRMLDASGIRTTTLTDRLVGNTAGLLIKQDVYETFTDKYEDATVANVLEASIAGDLTFAYTNPYTSSTGLNILASMLQAFDPDNPLSDQAAEKLLEYQKKSPPVAYTTSVLRNQAAKGVINAMVMERQAYINTPELKNYKFIPAGIRHDHPVYAFDYVNEDELAVAQMFIEFCMTDENQKLATEKGFNQDEDYIPDNNGLDGAGYLAAQKVWKQNKNGGKPIIAVFVTDVSGSMDGEPINSLKTSLISASSYISSDNYIGLVSYSDKVTINLPIAQFDATQRAYFAGEVKGLSANGGTATYDAILVALDMLQKQAELVPDAKLMLFVLTDGASNTGYSFNRISPIIGGMQIPVYSIAYNYKDGGELNRLSEINEAALINANSDDVVNQLRNLFMVEM